MFFRNDQRFGRAVAVAAAAILAPFVAWAEPPPTVVLLDATADMGAGDGAKFDLQRRAVEAAPMVKTRSLAFAAYGGADCGGYRAVDGVYDVAAGLNGIDPAGRRNLSAALETAAATLPSDAPRKRILALVGGADQCLAALCAKASKLKADAPALTVDVVGFGLSDSAARKLNCVAANTGGRFMRVGETGLATALALSIGAPTNVMAGLAAPRRPAAEPSPPPAAAPREAPDVDLAYIMTGPELSMPRGLRLSATLADGGTPLAGDVRFDLLRRDVEGVLRLVARTSRTATPLFDVPPGRYLARVVAGAAVRDLPVTAPAEGVSNRRIALDAGRLELAATVSNRAPSKGARFTIQRLDAPAEAIRREGGGQALVTLPAGRYRIDVELGVARASAEATVVADEVTRTAFDLAVGFLRVEGAPPGGDVRVLRFGKEVARAAPTDRPLFRLPPGAYRIAADAGAARAVVAAGGLVHVDLRRPDAAPTAPLTSGAVNRRLVAEGLR